MTWFKVDDSFHSHPKVLATNPAALGLWVVAGSWCSANLTDGFVPDHVLHRLIPGSTELARTLVAEGLWKRTKGGHRFHDWRVYQPTGEEAAAAKVKKSSGGRLGNHRRWHTARGVVDPRCPYCETRPGDRSPIGTDIGRASVPMGGPMPIRSDSEALQPDFGADSKAFKPQVNGHPSSDNRSDTDRCTESLPIPPTRPDPTRKDGGTPSDTGTGSQSVSAHARTREIHRYLSGRYHGGLTDQMSAAVFEECERRSPGPISHPVRYLRAMAEGDLADIVQAVMDAHAPPGPGEPADDPPDLTLLDGHADPDPPAGATQPPMLGTVTDPAPAEPAEVLPAQAAIARLRAERGWKRTAP